MEGLEDEADAVSTHARAAALVQPSDLDAIERERSFIGPVEQPQAMQQGALAGAAGAVDGHHLAGLDGEIQAVEDLQPGIAFAQGGGLHPDGADHQPPSRRMSMGSMRLARQAGSSTASRPTQLMMPMKITGISGFQLIGASGV